MDRHRSIALSCDRQLPAEGFDLFLQWGAPESSEPRVIGSRSLEHPAVEADLSDERVGIVIDAPEQIRFPVAGPIAYIPWMESEAR